MEEGPGPPASARRAIELKEHEARSLPREELSEADALRLRDDPGGRFEVEPPSVFTEGQWRIRPSGVVGIVPLDGDRHIAVRPKVGIGNVFRMLERVYRTDVFREDDDLVRADSVEELYASVVRILTRRVADRGRRGLHRRYEERSDRLPYLRGRMDTNRIHRPQVEPGCDCHYEQHTADHPDNQILLWTLGTVLRAGLGSDVLQGEVRSLWRSFRGAVTERPFRANECLGRTYHRLNADYRELHALCHFILSSTGPTHRSGDRTLAPFLIDMPHLFEKYAAAVVEDSLEEGLRLETDVRGYYDPEERIEYRADMVIRDTAGRVLEVLDAKYKDQRTPEAQDVAQVVAYALALTAPQATLLFPAGRVERVAMTVGSISVTTSSLGLMLR